MLFSEVSPFVRFAHTVNLTEKSLYTEVVPLDARLFCARSGVGEIIADGRVYRLKKDSVLLINAGISYKLCAPDGEVSYIAVNFDYNKTAMQNALPVPPVNVKAFTRDLLLAPAEFEDVKGLSRVLFLENIPQIQKRLSVIVNEYALQLAYFQEKISGILSECLIDCVRAENLITQAFENQTVGEVIRYVHENYGKPLTNVVVANAFSYHPNYISQLIKNVTGMPLHKYLIHVRLIKALSLLQNTDLSINEIALACGFCDSAYFSGYFKRQFKSSPSTFRKV